MGNAESSTLRHDRRGDRRTPHSRGGGDDSTFFSYGRDSTTIGPNASHVTSKTDLTLTRDDGHRSNHYTTRSSDGGDESTFFSYGRAESSIFPIESQWTHKTDFTLTRDTDPAVNSSNNTHTTASTSSHQSIADQSIAMMNKLVSGGAALCGSLNQVNDSDDDGDSGDTNHQGMFAKAERFVNCNKNFAKSSPMEEDYDARAKRRRDGNFLGPEEDSDDEVDGDDYSARIHAHNQSNSLNESSAASTVGRLFARAITSEIASKPQGMKIDNDTGGKRSKGTDPDEDELTSEAAGGGVGVDADRALRALKKFAMNAGGAADAPSDVGSKGPGPTNGDNGIIDSSIGGGGGITQQRAGPHTITIGLSLSRKHSVVGHPDTVTRQTAFDFNELQDRNYKYVSSTDPSGWLAGGGESPNGPMPDVTQSTDGGADDDGPTNFVENMNSLGKAADDIPKKIAAPDTVHIPLLHIDCPSEKAVGQVIKSLANGELIIPHMSVLPESLSASGDSPPDLVVRFGCERNDDLPSDEWPNWSLEFMHNQLYEYFEPLGARWEPRPFEVVLARKVKWRTVKHMNKYFAHCERVIDGWRENGPQYLFPQRNYLEGDGAASKEVSQPHGIYIWRGDNPAPSNYFPPNFEPPYNTSMKRALLSNLVNKSWDKKKRDWISEAIPKSMTPARLIGTMCGCSDNPNNRFSGLDASGPAVSPVAQSYHPTEYDTLFESNSLTDFDQTGEYSEFESLRQAQKEEQKAPTIGATVTNGIALANDSIGSGTVFGVNDSSLTNPSSISAIPINAEDNKGDILDVSTEFPEAEGSVMSKSSSAVNTRTPVATTTTDEIFFPPTDAFIEEHHQRYQQQQRDSSPAQDNEGVLQRTPNEGIDASRTQIERKRRAKKMEKQREQRKNETIADVVVQMQHVAKSGPKTIDSKSNKKSSSYENNEVKRKATSSKASVGESQTTVPITNKSKILETERKHRQQREIERRKEMSKVEVMEEKLQAKRDKAMQEERMRLQEQQAKAAEDRKMMSKRRNSGRNYTIVLCEEEERNHLIKEAQEETRKARALLSGSTENANADNSGKNNSQEILKSPSGETLEYSVDSSSIVLREKGNAANKFGGSDFSTSTTGSSLLPLDNTVPTDEELFAFGWAKALDPKSGAYYFFTLDRTQTVWTNPLTNRDLILQ